MEYCSTGSIRDLIEVCKRPLNEDQIAVVCLNTLKALTYLHSSNIIHRDVKAANILLDGQAGVKIGIKNISFRKDCKLILFISSADFGVSEKLGVGQKKKSGTMLGTPVSFQQTLCFLLFYLSFFFLVLS